MRRTVSATVTHSLFGCEAKGHLHDLTIVCVKRRSVRGLQSTALMSLVINNSILKWIFRRSHLQIWSSPFDRLNGGITHHFGSHRNASFPNYYYRATFSFAGRLIDSWPKCCYSVNENNTNTSALLNKNFIHKLIHLIISHQLQSICFAATGTN